MKKITTTTLLSLLTIFALGQGKSLSEQLWERAEPCNAMFEDFDEDGEVDYEELIDDSKNGYLKIAGSFPTCGCSCSHTVGAYKKADGEYLFLEKSTWSCGWTNRISSSKFMWSILPSNMSSEIIGYEPKRTFDHAYFYIDFEIPQHGTQTKLNIGIIPFGIEMPSKGSLLSFDYHEEGHIMNYANYHIQEIIRKFDFETLSLIISADFDKLSEKDKSILDTYVSADENESSKFSSYDEIALALQKLKDMHNYYQELQTVSFTLDWNRERSKFFIVSRDASPKEMSFQEFLEDITYWSPLC